MDGICESEIHFEFYRHFMNVMDSLKVPFNGIRHLRVKPEMSVNEDSITKFLERLAALYLEYGEN